VPLARALPSAEVLRAHVNAGRELEMKQLLLPEVVRECVAAAQQNSMEMPTGGDWLELRSLPSWKSYLAPSVRVTGTDNVFHLFRPIAAGAPTAELLKVSPGSRLHARTLGANAPALVAQTTHVKFLAEELRQLGYEVEYGFLNDTVKYPTQNRSQQGVHIRPFFELPQAIRVSWDAPVDMPATIRSGPPPAE